MDAFTTASTALASAATEIALSTNVPAFNDGQRMPDAIERLITTVTSIDQCFDYKHYKHRLALNYKHRRPQN